VLGQILADGLVLGGLYGMATLGFSLVWGVMGILNLAHGATVMLGAYFAFWAVHSLHVDPLWAIPIVLAVFLGAGYAFEYLALDKVIRADMLLTLLFTFGLDLALQNVGLLWWNADIRSIQTWYTGLTAQVGPVVVSYARVGILAAAVLLTWLAALFLGRTKWGAAIRATALHREAAELIGVNLRAVYALTFALGSALAGLAGVFYGLVNPISPFIGDNLLTIAFIVAVLGGLGDLAGALVGGVVLGLAQSLASFWIGPGWQNVVGLGVLLLILVVRPQGILGRRFYGA
jgi:branched-chain amino acid transport system permease protein